MDEPRAVPPAATTSGVSRRCSCASATPRSIAAISQQEAASLPRALSSIVLTGQCRGESQALTLAGEILFAEGDRREAWTCLRRARTSRSDAGFSWWRARVLRTMVDCTLELGRPEDAEHWLAEALELCPALGDGAARCSRSLVSRGWRPRWGRQERAGLIWGAIEAEERRATHGNWDQLRDDLAAPVLALPTTDSKRRRHWSTVDA